MKRIAVLTSGGDAPGMNAAIRAVVRTGLEHGRLVFGVHNGYRGLVEDDMRLLGARDVGGIIQRGGTILGSARCPEFEHEHVRRQGLEALAERGIQALVVIGGNGSQTGAAALARMGLPVVGVASTIDNDLCGSDVTIGVDTALNVALESIDRLKTTASSHHRAFLVEVMGRHCGYLALMAGIAGGAECIVIPEADVEPEEVAADLLSAYRRGKPHALVVVAEGARYNAEAMNRHFEEHHERIGFKLRVITLGHVQRGGEPMAFDRLLATRLGYGAVDCLERGEHGVLVGILDNRVSTTPLAEIVGRQKTLDPELLKMAQTLAK